MSAVATAQLGALARRHVRAATGPQWFPIEGAPQDGRRLMLWDSVSKRPLLASWRGGNPRITHYAAEPAGPEAA